MQSLRSRQEVAACADGQASGSAFSLTIVSTS
jgi:hypothetical protein